MQVTRVADIEKEKQGTIADHSILRQIIKSTATTAKTYTGISTAKLIKIRSMEKAVVRKR